MGTRDPGEGRGNLGASYGWNAGKFDWVPVFHCTTERMDRASSLKSVLPSNLHIATLVYMSRP